MNALENFAMPWADVLLKGLLISLLAGSALAFMRRASASQRNLVLRMAFSLLLVLPISAFLPPIYSIPWPRAAVSAPTMILAPMTYVPRAVSAETAAPIVYQPMAPSFWERLRELPWKSGLIGFWLAGVCGFLGYQALGLWRLRRLHRSAQAVDDEAFHDLAESLAAELAIQQKLRFRESASTRVPLAWGVFQPLVLLPAAWQEWSPAELESVLRHELGHIANADYLGRLVGHWACALHWPNPLVWMLARSLRLAQEQACDDLALGARDLTAEAYARLLLETARSLNGSGSGRSANPPSGALAMATPSTLERRLLAVMDAGRNRRRVSKGAILLACCSLGLIFVGLGSARVLAVEEKKPAPVLTVSTLPVSQVTLETKFMQVPIPELMELIKSQGGDPSKIGQLQALEPKQVAPFIESLARIPGAEMMSAPSVTTQSGRRAIISSGEPSIPDVPTLNLDITPTVDGAAVDLKMAAKFTWDGVDKPADLNLNSTEHPGTHELQIDALLSKGETGYIIGTPDPEKKRVTLLIIGVSAPPEPRDAPSRNDGTMANPGSEAERVGQLVLPSVDLKDADLVVALNAVQTASKEADPEGRGVALVIKRFSNEQGQPLGVLPGPDQVSFTKNLRNISVANAIRQLTAEADVSLAVTDTTYIVGPRLKWPEGTLQSAVEGDYGKKVAHLTLTEFSLDNATPAQAVARLIAAAQKADPDGQGLNIVDRLPSEVGEDALSKLRLDLSRAEADLAEARLSLGKNHPHIQELEAKIAAYRQTFRQEPRITLNLRDISVTDALQQLARLGDFRVSSASDAFMVEPKEVALTDLSAPAPVEPAPADTILEIREGGQMALNGVALDKSGLPQALDALPKHRRIVLRADRNVAYSQTKDVLLQVAQAQIPDVVFSTGGPLPPLLAPAPGMGGATGAEGSGIALGGPDGEAGFHTEFDLPSPPGEPGPNFGYSTMPAPVQTLVVDSEGPPPPRPNAITAEVQADGKVSTLGKLMTLEEFGAKVKELVKARPDQGIVLSAVTTAKAAEIKAVLQACVEGRVSNLMFSKPENSSPPTPMIPPGGDLILPKVSMDNLPLTEALDTVRKLAVEADLTKKGINLVYKKSDKADWVEPYITLSLTNIPAGQTLQYIANLSGGALRAEKEAYVLVID